MKRILLAIIITIIPFSFLSAQLVIDTLIATESRCAASGTITVNASGGALLNVYAITAGSVTAVNQSTNVFDALSPGASKVRVSDAIANEATDTVDVTGDYTFHYNQVLTAMSVNISHSLEEVQQFKMLLTMTKE